MRLSHESRFSNEWRAWKDKMTQDDTFKDMTYNDDDIFNLSEEKRIYIYFFINLNIIFDTILHIIFFQKIDL